ncbi:MAG: hypothetical protein HQL74_13725 [Magnetococcales bacterium]|nr:hypothetical protein [Magnetococcales bacterium]
MKPQKHKGKRWLAEEALYHLVDGAMTGKGLAVALGIQGKKLYAITTNLHGRGLVEKLAGGSWCLTARGILAAKEGWKIRGGRPGVERVPRKGGWTTRDKAWAALINRGGKGTLLDLAEEIDLRAPHQLHNIGCYFGALEKSGHLSRSHKKDLSGPTTNPGRHIWLLINNTGPKAPLWRSSKGEVVDRNSHEIIDISAKGMGHGHTATDTGMDAKTTGTAGVPGIVGVGTGIVPAGHHLVPRRQAGSART